MVILITIQELVVLMFTIGSMEEEAQTHTRCQMLQRQKKRQKLVEV